MVPRALARSTGRGRTHIDVSVPADQAEQRVKAAVAAGGRIVDDSGAPKWWTIASPDNHGVDIAGWPTSRPELAPHCAMPDG